MRLVKGINLNDYQKAEVLRCFVNRHTTANRPSWFLGTAPVALDTDRQWVLDHAFYINNDGSLSKKHNHCEPEYLAD